jgi:RND superfamily putative drug exporter
VRALTAIALRRPRGTLIVWGLAVVVLSLFGLGVQHRLIAGTLEAPGSQSVRAAELDRLGFGPNESIPILLSGPARDLDRQGPQLATSLRRRWSVLSPWDRVAGSARLRPVPGKALLLVNVTADETSHIGRRIDDVKRIVRTAIAAPVAARVSGFTAIGQAITDETLRSAAAAQLIAIPILLVVLLLVFRAPVAAAVPAIVGFATVTASAGIIALLAHGIALTALAVSVAAMMGLALGVDYSLLIVSRFREELAAGDGTDHARAVRTAAATAGRTVVFAGAALLMAMLVAVVLSPGTVLVSLTVGVTVAVVLSVLSGAAIVPALLLLLGSHVDRWRIGPLRTRATILPALAGFAIRHSRAVLAGSLLVLLVPAAMALGLSTAAPNPRVLPAHNAARGDFEQVSHLLGYGYAMPFEIAFHTGRELITEPHTLTSIERFQRVLLKDPRVAGVVGPGALATRAGSVVQIQKQIPKLSSQSTRASRGVARLRSGLQRASEGAGKLRDGAEQAQAGVARLQTGAQQLGAGASQLSDGVRAAADGTSQLAQGTSAAARGAARLHGGTTAARAGSQQLLQGIAAVDTGTAELNDGTRRLYAALVAGSRQMPAELGAPIAVASQQLHAAYDALARMTAGRDDPAYAAALASVANAAAMVSGTNPQTGAHVDSAVPGAMAQASAGLQTAMSDASKLGASTVQVRAAVRQVRDGAASLNTGLSQLDQGQAALSNGLSTAASRVQAAQSQFSRLTSGADQVAHGTSQLTSGLGRLGAIDQLTRGDGQLAFSLFQGYRDSAPLVSGLHRSSRTIRRFPSLRGERAAGHLVLAGIQSASAVRRSQAQYVLDIEGPGQAARVFVFPRTFPASAAGALLRDRLAHQTAAFAGAQGLDAAVGGPAAEFTDFQRVVSAFIPLLIVCLALLTYALLVVILRALVIPAIAITLNLVIVATTFGVMKALFQGSHPVLGGPGFVDVTTAAGIFTILFALSIDYQVFLLTRMREGFLRSCDADAAIDHGIAHTARVVTGAAAIMAAVFLSFALSEFIIPRQFGVGLAVAVLLDALVLRLFMLPAAMHMVGARGWWLPAWLDRLLPHLDVEGGTRPARAPRAVVPSET